MNLQYIFSFEGCGVISVLLTFSGLVYWLGSLVVGVNQSSQCRWSCE